MPIDPQIANPAALGQLQNVLASRQNQQQQGFQNNLAMRDQSIQEQQFAASQNALQTQQAKTDEQEKLKYAYAATETALRSKDPYQTITAMAQRDPTVNQFFQAAQVDPSNKEQVIAALQTANDHARSRLGIMPDTPKLQAFGTDQNVYAIDPNNPTAVGAPVIQGRDKIAEQQKFTAQQNALNRNVTMRGQDLSAQRSGVPSGYKANADGSLSAIPGGPADPDVKATSGLGSREGVMFQRVVNSANSAATALNNIAELPVGASTGTFGVGASPGASLFASAKGALTNKLASQDVQDYNTMIAGVGRNLSTIETAGLAPNGSITASMDSILMREGDTGITKLRKLAEMRQIIEKGIETNLSNPKLPKEQKDLVRSIITQVAKSIPYTQSDVTKLQARQAKNPDATLNDLIAEKGLSKPQSPAQGQPSTNAKGWTLHQDAQGNKAYVSPDGRQFEAAQ